jgi:hypothetical protein
MRHAFITAALDAGVPLRDVQEAASHADPRTTMHSDRARTSMDRHATYIVAAYAAGAARYLTSPARPGHAAYWLDWETAPSGLRPLVPAPHATGPRLR